MIAHGAAIAAVIVVGIPPEAKGVVGVALFIHLVLVARYHALLLASDAAISLEVGSGSILGVQNRLGAWAEYDVLGSTYVMPYLAVLNLRQSDSRAVRRVVILPDSMHPEDFRKLRVWLRWKKR